MVVFGKKSVHIPVSTHKHDEKKNSSMQLTVSDEGMNNSQWNQLKYVHQTFLAVKTTWWDIRSCSNMSKMTNLVKKLLSSGSHHYAWWWFKQKNQCDCYSNDKTETWTSTWKKCARAMNDGKFHGAKFLKAEIYLNLSDILERRYVMWFWYDTRGHIWHRCATVDALKATTTYSTALWLQSWPPDVVPSTTWSPHSNRGTYCSSKIVLRWAAARQHRWNHEAIVDIKKNRSCFVNSRIEYAANSCMNKCRRLWHKFLSDTCKNIKKWRGTRSIILLGTVRSTALQSNGDLCQLLQLRCNCLTEVSWYSYTPVQLFGYKVTGISKAHATI